MPERKENKTVKSNENVRMETPVVEMPTTDEREEWSMWDPAIPAEVR
jgi:hypothetical protein